MSYDLGKAGISLFKYTNCQFTNALSKGCVSLFRNVPFYNEERLRESVTYCSDGIFSTWYTFILGAL